MSTSRLEIDLAAIDRNVAIVRSVLAGRDGSGGAKVQLCGVIKQDAYGLGAPRIAKRLASIGVDLLAVYCVAEARKLADVPIVTPILVLMPIRQMERSDVLYRLAVRSRLHLTLHSLEQAQDVIALAGKLGVDFPVHVQVDTGLSRGGCLPDEAEKLVELVVNAPRVRLAGVMTHFSSPDTDEVFTREQAKLFRGWIERIKPHLARSVARGHAPCVVHAANTCATFRSDQFHATMVRVGQAMYGYGSESFTDPENVDHMDAARRLIPAVRWLSRIVHVHDVPAGWPVGYGRTFVTERASRIAVVPIGYADGYPRALGNVAQVRLTGLVSDRPRTIEPLESHNAAQPKGVWAPVVGRVSMDQITLDVTDVPEHLCTVGMEVEVIGNNPDAANHLPLIAEQAGTITHDILCRVSPALERTYLFSANDETVIHDAAPVVGRIAAVPGSGKTSATA